MKELTSEQVRKVCSPALIRCSTTDELSPTDEIIGQERALRALRFGLEIDEPGFNIYAAGTPGTGKTTTVKAFLEELAAQKPAPSDWCYVYDFGSPSEPKALELPRGMAKEFRKDMASLIDTAKKVIPEVFDSDDYTQRRQKITNDADRKRGQIFSDLNKIAQKKGFALQSSASGLLAVPLVGGQPMGDKEISQLSPEAIEKVRLAKEGLDTDLRNAMRELHKLEGETNAELEKLNREAAMYAIGHIVHDLKEKYASLPNTLTHVDEVMEEVLSNLAAFAQQQDQSAGSPEAQLAIEEFYGRFKVNVVVDNSELKGAPVIVEDNPTYQNLFGRIEKEARFGILMTDFTMIQAGSIHRANGGYLVIQADQLVMSPMSLDSLKRAIKNRKIMIEELPPAMAPLAAKGLKPEPIGLNLKVILIGNPEIYEILNENDPEFRELFKVKAHFDTSMPRNEDNVLRYTRTLGSVCKREGLKALDVKAAAKIIEYSSRLAEDKERLSTRFADISDVVREAAFYSAKEGSSVVEERHIRKAIEEKTYRSNLVQERLEDMIRRGQILVDTGGDKVGQVNGLVVMTLGDFSFGSPSRVTATVGVGRHGIIDIERESQMGGPTHTKGVMIISGYLSRLFARDKPLSLSARLVFEQSYSGVEGDSASSTELYAILSALSGLPITQRYAVTGSVNQLGEVQAIGGVNEKIEGFFEVCKMRGLDGTQGVLIPASNVQNLMLKEEVVEAIEKGLFHVIPVQTIEQGIEILTGVPAGVQGNGSFGDGSVYYRADTRLKEMAETLRRYSLYAD